MGLLFIFRVAFVKYETKSDADAEMKKMNNYELDGRTLKVEVAKLHKKEGISAPSKTLVIRNMSYNTTTKSLKEVFSTAIDVRVIKDQKTGEHRG